MIGVLDLFLFYCSVSSPVCVQTRPTVDPPLTEFSDCESVGRAGDPEFQYRHPDFKLRAFTCALRPGVAA